jgi:hypothetical protein
MSNKQQSSIKWLIEKFSSVLGKTYFTDEQNFLLIKYSEQAKEMEIMGREMSYSDGYAEGYKRALELVEWKIKNELKIDNK